MNKKRLVCAAIAALMVLFSFPIVSHAADHPLTDGATLDISTCASGDTVSVDADAAVTISGSRNNIQISCGAGAKVTLSGVTIDNSGIDNSCPLSFTGSGNELTLAAGTTSRLTAGDLAPGVQVADGTELTIGGTGTLYATSGLAAAGIGGEIQKSSGSITITGGTIIATAHGSTSGVSGAGIGGGAEGCGTVTITGGIVTATSENGGAGIGGGCYGPGGTVTITGGAVTAKAEKIVASYLGKDIGSGRDGGSGGTLNVDGAASLTLQNTGTNAAVTLGDAYISDTSGGIANGYYVNGSHFNGTIIDLTSAHITPGSDPDSYLVTGSTATATYGAGLPGRTSNIVLFAITGISIVLENGTNNIELCGKNTLSGACNAFSCQNTVATFNSTGDVTGSLTATGGPNGAGIRTTGGTVNIQSGIIQATGGEKGAGIGGGEGETGGTIHISGGTVTAQGGNNGAGIGGGYNAACGVIQISGGTVTATGCGMGAAIGSGAGDNTMVSPTPAGSITIRGSADVTATATGGYGCGIGGGQKNSIGTVRIEGGNVHAQGSIYGAGIGGAGGGGEVIISGGDVTATGGNVGAGIGGNYNKNNELGITVTITGGIVHAYGGDDANNSGAGIGGSDANEGNGPAIHISGGVVYATGGKRAAGIGNGYNSNSTTGVQTVIDGGTVYAQAGSGTAQDIGKGVDGHGGDGTLSISGSAVVFMKNDTYITPTTTHTHKNYAAGTTKVEGMDIPGAWTGAFGAFLHYNTITYDANNGSGAPPSDTELYGKSGTIADGSGVTRTGYSFGGWNTLADGLGTDYSGTYKFTDDLYLYAKWTPHTYTVKYDNNGGSGSMADQGFTYDISQALSQNAFTRNGYTFAGWAEDKDGAVKYKDKQSVSNLTADKNGSVTLYAKWTPVNYTIGYNLNGGTATPDNPAGYTVESDAITLNNPTRTGYAFSGWSGTGLSGTSMLVTIPKGSAGNREYTASWLANGCTVKFNSNGGSAVADQAVLYDGKITKPGDPSREGFLFKGWYADAALGAVWNFDTDTVKGDTTLYAKWESSGVYKITVKSSPAAGGKAKGAGSYSGGDNVTLTAVPADGYRFVKWTEGKKTVSQNAVYTFVSSKNRTVTACFTKIGRPAISSASSAGYNGAKLKWSKVTGASGYNIYRSGDKNGPYKKAGSSKTAAFTDSRLVCGKTYYYKIQACCTAGKKTTTGDFSGARSAKPVPGTPKIADIAKKSAESVKITWSNVDGASGYEIVRSTDSKSWGYWYINTTGKTSYTNGGLKEGATYYYRVRAFRTVGGKNVYGSYSNIFSVKMK